MIKIIPSYLWKMNISDFFKFSFNFILFFMSAKKQKCTVLFDQRGDFDFTISRVVVTCVACNRVPKLVPVTRFSLFGITFSEAQKIASSFNVLADHVCSTILIEE